MRSKGILSLFFLLWLPATAVQGSDVETLREAFEQTLERLNAKDLPGFLQGWHSEAVLIVHDYVFPVDRADAGEEIWTPDFRRVLCFPPRASASPRSMSIRGWWETRVWSGGSVQTITESKDGLRRTRNLRLTATFIKMDGQWRILSWHNSLPPQRNPRPSSLDFSNFPCFAGGLDEYQEETRV